MRKTSNTANIIEHMKRTIYASKPGRVRHVDTTADYQNGRTSGGPVHGRYPDGTPMPITVTYADGREPVTRHQGPRPVATIADLMRLRDAWSA
jgi:hypothetical protein